MNMSRSSKRFGFFRRSGKELLPVEPVKDITILPWWIVQLGFVTEEDMKLADKAEVRMIHTKLFEHTTVFYIGLNNFFSNNDFDIFQNVMVDQIIDNGPCPVGHLNYDTVLVLYLKVKILYFRLIPYFES